MLRVAAPAVDPEVGMLPAVDPVEAQPPGRPVGKVPGQARAFRAPVEVGEPVLRAPARARKAR